MKIFIDRGYSDPHTFCIQFLQSPEFKLETLMKFIDYHPNKSSAATDVARKVRDNSIDKKLLMLEYAKQTRQWFALKTGEFPDPFEAEDPEKLLTEFGDENWYGPIENDEDDSKFYFRNHSFNDYRAIDGKVEVARIRWVVVANVAESHLTFHWNGFTTNSSDNTDSRSQFQFWNYIPDEIGELEDALDVEYDYPDFHQLILEEIWDNYISNPEYTWNHLAVRAEASGVALNARSAGVQQLNVTGLLGLANKLAISVIDEIEESLLRSLRSVSRRDRLIERAEIKIIKTLIKDWGTKSYEFRLVKGDDKVFRAHSYFGLKPDHNTQDCFPHFKTYLQFGGACKAIEFLLSELGDD